MPSNPWLFRRPLNFAHQGGAREAPSNTLYAFKTAIEKGADVLEMDAHATKDGHLVVIHDATVDRTTNGSGRVDETTLADLKTLDAAFWWVPGEVTAVGQPAHEYVFRGVATNKTEPPDGYSANDFTVPTLREVLETFPDVFLNIEIKATAPETAPYEKEFAELLREFGRTDDTMVGSFQAPALETFRRLAPEVSTSASPGEVEAFMTGSGTPSGRVPYHALQVPPTYEGLTVVDRHFVEMAQEQYLAVHVWTVDDEEEMAHLLAVGVQGIMTDRPLVLESILAGTR